MPSLRDLVTSSVVPVPAPIRLAEIAKLVGLDARPASGARVMDFLEQPIVRSSGTLHAQTVHAFGALALHPSGMYKFVGHAHENGVVGNIYAFSCGIDVRDNEGRALAIPPHEKKLSGTADITGSRNDDFDITGFDERIRDRWQEVSKASVRFSLHAATDPGQVAELVTEALVAALAVAGLTFLLVKLIPLIPVPELIVQIGPNGEFIFKLVWHFSPPAVDRGHMSFTPHAMV